MNVPLWRRPVTTSKHTDFWGTNVPNFEADQGGCRAAADSGRSLDEGGEPPWRFLHHSEEENTLHFKAQPLLHRCNSLSSLLLLLQQPELPRSQGLQSWQLSFYVGRQKTERPADSLTVEASAQAGDSWSPEDEFSQWPSDLPPQVSRMMFLFHQRWQLLLKVCVERTGVLSDSCVCSVHQDGRHGSLTTSRLKFSGDICSEVKITKTFLFWPTKRAATQRILIHCEKTGNKQADVFKKLLQKTSSAIRSHIPIILSIICTYITSPCCNITRCQSFEDTCLKKPESVGHWGAAALLLPDWNRSHDDLHHVDSDAQKPPHITRAHKE